MPYICLSTVRENYLFFSSLHFANFHPKLYHGVGWKSEKLLLFSFFICFWAVEARNQGFRFVFVLFLVGWVGFSWPYISHKKRKMTKVIVLFELLKCFEGLRMNKQQIFLFQDNINVEEMFRSITELVLRSKKGGQPRALKPNMGLPWRK